jgi:hypothetical protein
LREGITFPTALAAPVEAGIKLVNAERPARQSLPPLAGPSTTSWLAVAVEKKKDNYGESFSLLNKIGP